MVGPPSFLLIFFLFYLFDVYVLHCLWNAGETNGLYSVFWFIVFIFLHTYFCQKSPENHVKRAEGRLNFLHNLCDKRKPHGINQGQQSFGLQWLYACLEVGWSSCDNSLLEPFIKSSLYPPQSCLLCTKKRLEYIIKGYCSLESQVSPLAWRKRSPYCGVKRSPAPTWTTMRWKGGEGNNSVWQLEPLQTVCMGVEVKSKQDKEG